MKNFIFIILGLICFWNCNQDYLTYGLSEKNLFLEANRSENMSHHVSFLFNDVVTDGVGSCSIVEYGGKDVLSFGLSFPHENPKLSRHTGLNLYLTEESKRKIEGEYDLKNSWHNRLSVHEVGTDCGTAIENYDSIVYSRPNYFIIDKISSDSTYIEGRFGFMMTQARCLLGYCPDKNYVITNPQYWNFTEGQFRVPFNNDRNSPLPNSRAIENKRIMKKKSLLSTVP